MTVLAAIFPPNSPPLFVCDTLISAADASEGKRMLTPGGLIRPAKDGSGYHPQHLEQKTLIINGRVFAAYAGATFIGSIIFRKLRAGLSVATNPSREDIEVIIKEYEDEIVQSDTSILIAFYNKGAIDCLTYGGFEQHKNPDGTEIYITGTGASSLLSGIDALLSGMQAVASITPETAINYHLCAAICECVAYEALTASFDSHFGGIVELIYCTEDGFSKLPSALIVIELIEVADGVATSLGANYLKYRYVDDILVFHRFGQLNYEEIMDVFQTDNLVSTIEPPYRNVTSADKGHAIDTLMAERFDDAVLHFLSWTNTADMSERRVTVMAPDHAHFQVIYTDKEIKIWRSKEFNEKIARRFGANRVRIALFD